MTKRSCLIGMLFSVIAELVFGYSFVQAYNDAHWMSYVLFILAGGMLIAFLQFLSDYRYLNGSYTQKELERSRHYSYWYETYGNNFHYEYRIRCGFNGKYTRVANSKSFIKPGLLRED